MEPLGLSSGLAGLLSLGITVCQGLLDYYQAWRDAEDDVAKTYGSIEALSKTLRLLELTVERKEFDDSLVDQVRKSIESTTKSIQSLRKKLDKVRVVALQDGWSNKAKARFRRTLYPFKESTLAKLRELSSELRGDLSLALDLLQVDASAAALSKLDLLGRQAENVSAGVDFLKKQSLSTWADVNDIRGSTKETARLVDGLASTQSSDHVEKVLEWLSPTLTSDLERKQMDTLNIRGRQDGLWKSLLKTNEFQSWLRGDGETLWCPGIRRAFDILESTCSQEKLTKLEGTGKTVLSSFLIQFLRGIVNRKHDNMAYIYFDHKEAEKQTTSNLLASLCHQLLRSELTLPDELVLLYQAHKSRGSYPSLMDYTKLLHCVVCRYSKVFIIIDALDECSDKSRDLMTELQRLQPRLRLLVTSRDLPNIQCQLERAARLEVRARDEDIIKYLQERIASSERICRYTEKDSDLPDNIVKIITSKADGMFLQARLHLESLSTKTTLRKLRTALETLPEGLDKTYAEAMNRIKGQHPDQSALAVKVLEWITCAVRPLTLFEMQHALAVEPGDASFDDDNVPGDDLLVTICSGLVTYHQESNVLGLVHYSLQQYFERELERPEVHAEILEICLTYLSFTEFEDMELCNDFDFSGRLILRPFLPYAIINWVEHAMRAESLTKTLLMDFLLQDTSRDRLLYLTDRIDPIYRLHSSYKASWGLIRQLPPGSSALQVGSLYGLEQIVGQLLDQGHDTECDFGGDGTALHCATACGHYGVVSLLLKSGADITREDLYSRAPLEVAARAGQGTIVRLLLNYDFNKQLKSGKVERALQEAARRGHYFAFQALVEKLLHTGQGDLIGKRIVHMASFGGSLSCVEYLANIGFDLHAVDEQHRTCLHHCAAAGSVRLLDFLLKMGLDVNGRDIDGWTPLLWAAKSGKVNSIQKLLEEGASTKPPAIQGWSASAIAMYHENFIAAETLSLQNKRPSDPTQSRQLLVSLLHEGVICDGCEMYVFGPLFKCISCPDFDFCFKCYLSSDKTHGDHVFDLLDWNDPDGNFDKISWKNPVEVMVELEAREVLLGQWREQSNMISRPDNSKSIPPLHMAPRESRFSLRAIADIRKSHTD